MKFRGTKLSKRTLALLAAAVVLLGGSGFTGTRAALNVIGPNYDATIATNAIDVAITEQVGGKGDVTTIDKTTKDKPGELTLTADTDLAIGKVYADNVAVKNMTGTPEFVRVIVRKYWTKDGVEKTELTQKLAPEWIELNVADSSKWIVKDSATKNNEYSVYYLKNALAANASEVLFDGFRINEKVKTEGKKIMINGEGDYATDEAAKAAAKPGDVITYSYTYDGCTFNVEVEAQSVQTHNAADAIKSVWGVTATVSGETITAVN